MTTEETDRHLVVLGCGYVGREVVARAVTHGCKVSALTRNAEKAEELRCTFGIPVIEADLSSPSWHRLLDPAGAWIVNCVSSGGGGESGYRHSYLEGAKSIVEWIRSSGEPQGLLYTGSTSVYPQSSGEWVDEAADTAASTPLNAILLETEAVFRDAVHQAHLPRAAVLRLAGIYGPQRHYLIDQIWRGETHFSGRGDYFLNLIHRDDAAEAVLSLVYGWSATGFEIFNVADGSPATKEAIAAWTAEQFDKPAPVFHPDQLNERMRRRMLAPGGIPNRRIRARKLSQTSGWKPHYPDFKSGYGSLITALPSPHRASPGPATPSPYPHGG